MRVPLEESVVVARPLEVVWARFMGDGNWFEPLAMAAEEDGEALYFRVGPAWAGEHLARKVSVTLGAPHNRGKAIVVPLSWQASALPGLFPVLDGELVVAAVDAERCSLTLIAAYIPPFGEVGRQLDRSLMARVGVSTVRAFLDGLADTLADPEVKPRDVRPWWH